MVTRHSVTVTAFGVADEREEIHRQNAITPEEGEKTERLGFSIYGQFRRGTCSRRSQRVYAKPRGRWSGRNTGTLTPYRLQACNANRKSFSLFWRFRGSKIQGASWGGNSARFEVRCWIVSAHSFE